ncbi:MFS transporter [Candidatus Spyradosoma sp. SGI.093]|uniref:MFS transporter n=1 Tax=Candidatus Spyradosoma sp. SGI.093 TaxID=3420583 RepID=UPI003CFF8867
MSKSTSIYNKYLLFIAGLGGLLYGIDVGVIAGALPYLQATTNYTPGQLSTVVAAVLLGSVLSSLFAGALSDLFGRKKIMILAGVCFVLSVPVICVPEGFYWLVAGRILQGAAAGLIGVVVPLYLAECLTADKRGFGTGMFQFMLTVGLVFAAAVGLYFASQVEAVSSAEYASVAERGAAILAEKNFAWRAIFWACAVPGVIFSFGALFISESARWLYKKNRIADALKALARSRGEAEARKELDEMGSASAEEAAADKKADAPKDSLLQKKYIVPFVLAVIILACNQATGINSVLAYIVDVLKQAGLDGSVANQGDLVVKILNMVMTIVAMVLVDRKGRKFLLTVGTTGIIVGLIGVAALFLNAESKMQNFTDTLNPAARGFERTEVIVNEKTGLEEVDENGAKKTHVVKYAYYSQMTKEQAQALMKTETFVPAQVKFVYTVNGDMNVKTLVVREDTPADELEIKVPYEEGQTFEVKSFEVGPLPSEANGWFATLFFAIFIAAYAVGPGVCVWLALSELMPNRIRAMGMSIALLINQGVSTVIAGTFLPVVGNFGYSTIFFFCAGCTVIYWITAVFFLPETKGRTLEEIEAHFEGKKKL